MFRFGSRASVASLGRVTLPAYLGKWIYIEVDVLSYWYPTAVNQTLPCVRQTLKSDLVRVKGIVWESNRRLSLLRVDYFEYP